MVCKCQNTVLYCSVRLDVVYRLSTSFKVNCLAGDRQELVICLSKLCFGFSRTSHETAFADGHLHQLLRAGADLLSSQPGCD